VAVPVNATTDQLDQIPLSEVQGFKEPALPWYSDQVLPLTSPWPRPTNTAPPPPPSCSASRSSTKVFGTSIDDSVLEQQATFVARSLSPLQAVRRTSFS